MARKKKPLSDHQRVLEFIRAIRKVNECPVPRPNLVCPPKYMFWYARSVENYALAKGFDKGSRDFEAPNTVMPKFKKDPGGNLWVSLNRLVNLGRREVLDRDGNFRYRKDTYVSSPLTSCWRLDLDFPSAICESPDHVLRWLRENGFEHPVWFILQMPGKHRFQVALFGLAGDWSTRRKIEAVCDLTGLKYGSIKAATAVGAYPTLASGTPKTINGVDIMASLEPVPRIRVPFSANPNYGPEQRYTRVWINPDAVNMDAVRPLFDGSDYECEGFYDHTFFRDLELVGGLDLHLRDEVTFPIRYVVDDGLFGRFDEEIIASCKKIFSTPLDSSSPSIQPLPWVISPVTDSVKLPAEGCQEKSYNISRLSPYDGVPTDQYNGIDDNAGLTPAERRVYDKLRKMFKRVDSYVVSTTLPARKGCLNKLAKYLAKRHRGLTNGTEIIPRDGLARAIGVSGRTASAYLTFLRSHDFLELVHEPRFFRIGDERNRAATYRWHQGMPGAVRWRFTKAPLFQVDADGFYPPEEKVAGLLHDIRACCDRGYSFEETLRICMGRQANRPPVKQKPAEWIQRNWVSWPRYRATRQRSKGSAA